MIRETTVLCLKTLVDEQLDPDRRIEAIDGKITWFSFAGYCNTDCNDGLMVIPQSAHLLHLICR